MRQVSVRTPVRSRAGPPEPPKGGFLLDILDSWCIIFTEATVERLYCTYCDTEAIYEIRWQAGNGVPQVTPLCGVCYKAYQLGRVITENGIMEKQTPRYYLVAIRSTTDYLAVTPEGDRLYEVRRGRVMPVFGHIGVTELYNCRDLSDVQELVRARSEQGQDAAKDGTANEDHKGDNV